MSVMDVYYEKCRERGYSADPNQENILQHLDRISISLERKTTYWNILTQYIKKPSAVKGLYLYGSVGAGKTFLMDCLYDALPFQQKLRIHFHEFMQLIHAKLRSYSNIKNPLKSVAKELSNQYKIIFFDEFYVNDIVDAMLLGGLLRALYHHGIILIATSNAAPDDLYKNGLQRDLFKKTITLIKYHNECLQLKTDTDYRLKHFQRSGVFYSSQDTSTHHSIHNLFQEFSVEHSTSENPVDINSRSITVVKRSHQVIWIDFEVLCHAPRSQDDYLVMAKQYQIVIVQNIRPIPPLAKNMIALLIKLIDVLYDKKIALVCSLSCSINEIYPEGPYAKDFERIKSRLIEMNSFEYFNENLP